MSDKQITWIAISVSVLLHLALAGFLLFGPSIETNKKTVKPVAIKAKVIDLKPKSPPKPIAKKPVKKPIDTKALERKKQLEREKQLKKQQEQQKKLKQKREQERLKKLAAQKAAKKKAEKEKAEKAKKEKVRQEQLKKEKQERERKEKERKEKELKEKERKEKLEKERKEKQRKAEEAKRKKEEQAQRDALASAMAKEEAEFQAEENEQIAAGYVAMIKKNISRNWNRPPNTKNGMVVELLIELLPNGMVSSVSISKSSGDDGFDRSAVNAVNKAEQFKALADAPPDVFETYFRRFTLKFKPEDLAR